jgi:hypothetical protein
MTTMKTLEAPPPTGSVDVPGATHLFEEPGALDAVADLATDWFIQHFTPPAQ